MIRDEENKSCCNHVNANKDVKEYNFAVKVSEEEFLLVFYILGFKSILVVLLHGDGVKLIIFDKLPLLIETGQYPGNFLFLNNSKRLEQVNSFHVFFS